ncbi:MAG: 3-keto-L-gulonate-6-phosphate decarboxylase UlaD [Fusobacteriaceae bacterium]
MRPLLQVALDNNTLSGALKSANSLGSVVDIIEAGTILCLQEGMEAIRCLRALFPNKIILADTKCADAGGTVAKNCRLAGANWMTIICCATLPTMKAALNEIDDLQVELYGDWTYEQAAQWKEIGLSQVVYHQSRDALLAGETWGENDLIKIKKLIKLGFKVSVTGGLELETLELFKGINIYCFIAGRSLRDADSPYEMSKLWQNKIKSIWG